MPNELANRLAERNNRFGLELMAKLHRDGENLFLSPLGIASALQMTSGSAAGETLTEMLKTMHVEDLELVAANRALIDLSLAQAGGTLSFANSLWGNSEVLNLNEDFAAECRKYYSAEVHALPFGDPSTVAIVNGWVKGQTAGKISHVVDAFPKDQAGCLISAVHFKGSWNAAFDRARTEEADFTLLGGRSKKVQMMNSVGVYPYVETREYQAVGLSFGQYGSTVMWFIIPVKRRRLPDLQRLLDAERLKAIAGSSRCRGRVSIPRFTLRSESELTNSLGELGMVQAFDARTADFSHFSLNKAPFFINRVLHNAVLEVNEAGAEAAALSMVGVVLGASRALPSDTPFNFVADQPFFVAIVDKGTVQEAGSGAVLFAGAVYEPASQ